MYNYVFLELEYISGKTMVMKRAFLKTSTFQRHIIYKVVILQKISYMLILKRKHQANNLVKVSNTNTHKKLSTKTIKTLEIGLNLLLKSRTNAPS